MGGEHANNSFSVVRFDMNRLRPYSSVKELDEAIIKGLQDFTIFNDLDIFPESTGTGTLLKIIYYLYKTRGQVVILIDEYDKPILDNLTNLKKANEMREVLCSFYLTLKSSDKYLRFVVLTEISKFNKVGVF